MTNRASLLPPYLVNTIRDDITTPWVDMANAIDAVFGPEIDIPLSLIRDGRKIFLQNSVTDAKSTANSLIDFQDWTNQRKNFSLKP